MTWRKKQSPVRIVLSSRTGDPISTMWTPGKTVAASEEILLKCKKSNFRFLHKRLGRAALKNSGSEIMKIFSEESVVEYILLTE